jgi:cytochrome c biogenesis protein
VIFVGAIIGSLAGYKGFVTIVEGTSINAFESRSGQQVPLGFEVLCEKFNVEFYSTGAPKEFRSTLTILEHGKPVPGYSQVKVIVNEPLTYKGITFYQSSYGQASEGGEHYVTVSSRNGGKSEKFTVREGVAVTLKDGTTFKLIEATQDVRPFAPGFSGPAARIEVTRKGGTAQTFITFKNYPDVNAQRGDALIFGYEGTNAKQYTGLQVARDPGVWVVWLGCTLMVLGIFIAFFMSHKRIWVVVSKGHVRIYGNASKNQAAFQMQFEDISEKFQHLKI